MNILKELIAKKQLRQTDIAEMVVVSHATVSDWVRNRKDPRGKNLRKLSEILGVDELVILGTSPQLATESADEKSLDAELVDMLVSLPPDKIPLVLAFVSGLKASDERFLSAQQSNRQ